MTDGFNPEDTPTNRLNWERRQAELKAELYELYAKLSTSTPPLDIKRIRNLLDLVPLAEAEAREIRTALPEPTPAEDEPDYQRRYDQLASMTQNEHLAWWVQNIYGKRLADMSEDEIRTAKIAYGIKPEGEK